MTKFFEKNLIIITGSSGVGKTTIAKELIKRNKKIKQLITYTTRKKRKGERARRDYNFVTKSQFEKMIKKGELFEWAKVYGNYYGNKKSDLERICLKNKICLIVLDVQGAKKLKKIFPKIKIFFITATAKDILARLKKRGNNSEAEIKLRQKQLVKYQTNKKNFKHIIYNREKRLDEAVEKIEGVIKKTV